eukprot:Lankesteria_metandrocarpae@DN3025_c0_g2_i1.p3
MLNVLTVQHDAECTVQHDAECTVQHDGEYTVQHSINIVTAQHSDCTVQHMVLFVKSPVCFNQVRCAEVTIKFLLSAAHTWHPCMCTFCLPLVFAYIRRCLFYACVWVY